MQHLKMLKLKDLKKDGSKICVQPFLSFVITFIIYYIISLEIK